MAKVVISKRHTTYTVLQQSIVGPAKDYFHISDVVPSGQLLTFQATLVQDADLVKMERLEGNPVALTDEQVELFHQYRWDQAPSWANFAAVNEDGSGAWYADKPVLDESRGRWVFSYGDRRSWPMYSTIKLVRPWKETLRERPTGAVLPKPPAPPEVCKGYEGTIITDVIGYIEATLGNIPVLPPCTWPACDCYPTASDTPQMGDTTPTEALAATVLVEVSNNALDWTQLGAIPLSGTTLSGILTASKSWPYVRGRVSNISGQYAFAKLTMGV